MLSAMCGTSAVTQIKMKIESWNLKLPMLGAFTASLPKMIAARSTPTRVNVSAT